MKGLKTARLWWGCRVAIRAPLGKLYQMEQCLIWSQTRRLKPKWLKWRTYKRKTEMKCWCSVYQVTLVGGRGMRPASVASRTKLSYAKAAFQVHFKPNKQEHYQEGEIQNFSCCTSSSFSCHLCWSNVSADGDDPTKTPFSQRGSQPSSALPAGPRQTGGCSWFAPSLTHFPTWSELKTMQIWSRPG